MSPTGVEPARAEAPMIGLVRVMDDTVTMGDSVLAKGKRNEDSLPPPPPPMADGMPILLGHNRLAYLQLPKDWDRKDLPKLLKML